MKPAEKQGYKDASRYSHLTPEELEEYAARQGATNADYARGMRIYAEEMKRYVPEQRNPASQKPSSSSIKTLQQAHKQDQERDRAEQQGYTDAPKIGHLPPNEFEAYAAGQDANNADYARGLRRYAQERAHQNQERERAEQQGYTDSSKISHLSPREFEAYAAGQDAVGNSYYAMGMRRYAQERAHQNQERERAEQQGYTDAPKIGHLQPDQFEAYVATQDANNADYARGMRRYAQERERVEQQGYEYASRYSYLTPEVLEAYAAGQDFYGNVHYARGIRRYAKQ